MKLKQSPPDFTPSEAGITNRASRRQPGGWEGKVWIAEGFDEPLPQDLQESFEGGTTEAMNRALEEIGEQQDPWVTATSRQMLAKVEWENGP